MYLWRVQCRLGTDIIIWHRVDDILCKRFWKKYRRLQYDAIFDLSNRKLCVLFIIVDFSEIYCVGATPLFHHRTYYRNELIINETTTLSILHCNDMCLQEMQCRDFQYNSTSEFCRMNAADFRASLVGSLTDCEFLCALDAQCLGYFFKADEKKCRLSNSKVSEYTPSCEYCMFSTKQCSNGK